MGKTMTEAEFKIKAETYWLKAAKIVSENPDLDIGDVFHAFWCLACPLWSD